VISIPDVEWFKMISIIEGQAKIIDMRKKSCIYVGLRKFKDTVSKGRTQHCGVRYTRKKLPLALHRGGVERDSWDMSSFKTSSLGRQFLRSTRLGRFWPELPIKEITLEQLPHQPKTHSKTAAYRGNCGGSFLGEFNTYPVVVFHSHSLIVNLN